MDFRILGPLEALDEGRAVALGGSKQRALLALLLLHANETLSTDRLIDELWGERPPANAAKSVQMQISRLRKALAGEAGNGSAGVVVTRERGYQLVLDPERLDAHRFERLIALGRSELAAGRPRRAASALEKALALWRGRPLDDLAYEPFVQHEIARLDDLHIAAIEQLIDARLALGRHAEVVAQLERLIADYPYRERLRAQLMLALYRSDRQADALQAYQDARRALVEELGIEPGERLRELERAILAQEPALVAPAMESDIGDHGDVSSPPTDQPSGVVTFLLTDIEGSSALWEADPEGMAAALKQHDELIAHSMEAHGGRLLKTKGEGDSTVTAFRRASDAVAAAVVVQEAFAAASWPGELELRMRIAVHTGEAHERDGDYFGPALNRAARLRALTRGGATVVSQATAEIVHDRLPRKAELVDLGRHQLRGLSRPENVFELRPVAAQAAGEPTAVTVEPAVPGPALEVPRGRFVVGLEAPARRAKHLRVGRRLALVGAVLLAAAATAAGLIELTRDGGSAGALSAVAPDSVAVVDPRSNRIVGEIAIPGQPSLVAADGRSVWVASDTSRTISRIDGHRLRITKVVPTNAIPRDLAATAGAVWLLDRGSESLVKVSSAYGSVAERLPLRPGERPGPRGAGVDVGQGAVWVVDGSTRLLKVGRGDAHVVKRFELPQRVDGVSVGARSVWAISAASANVLEIDPASGSARPPIPITSRPGSTTPVPIAVAAGERAIWVLNGNAPSVTRIDPEQATVTETIPLTVGSNPTAIATGAGAVWVALSGEGSVARIDRETGDVLSVPVGGAPTGVAVSLGKVWISVQPSFRSGLASRGRTIRVPGEVSEPFCSGVEFAGEGTPEVLIVSDLPLQHGSGPFPALQLSDAVRFVLARRGFRAGRYSVGYQSCDDSSVGRGAPYNWTPATCRRNARAYANAPIVLGVIGPFDSACGAFQIPILNRARGAPLAQVSGTATSVGLTHEGPGSSGDEPEVYYPRGLRNFARVVAADDVQGTAIAVTADRLGVTRLFVLEDGETYGSGIAAQVQKSAKRLGLSIAGTGRWDYGDRGFVQLAKSVERSAADGVFLGGFVPGEDLRTPVRDLRAVLGREVRLFAPDGFSDFEALVQGEGSAAEGIVVSLPVVPATHLPGPGRDFVKAFEEAVSGQTEPFSASVAQATAVLLDAIAASDGTRASVTRHLLRTRVENGILGSFAFDENGDTTAAGVTMYRIENGTPKVLDVVTPPRDLVR